MQTDLTILMSLRPITIGSMVSIVSAHAALRRAENFGHAGTLFNQTLDGVVGDQQFVRANPALQPVALHLSQGMPR